MSDEKLAAPAEQPPWGTRVASLGLKLFWVSCILILLGTTLIGPMPGGIRYPGNYRWVQTSRTIALAAFSYANDHDSQYPDGKSSTEVFQKLIDGKYITDPMIFYVPLKGKTRPVEGHPLKPENVSWDFTGRWNGSGLGQWDPDALPVVFLTGYQLDYVAGNATPVIKPHPVFTYDNGSWFPWGSRRSPEPVGLAVAYKNYGAKFIPLDSSGVIPHVISADLKVPDKTYRQLTPEGPLP